MNSSHLFRQIFPAADRRKMLHRCSEHFSKDFSFGKDGEALVEPEVLEVDVGDKISGPAVSDLVRDHIRQRLIAALMFGDCNV